MASTWIKLPVSQHPPSAQFGLEPTLAQKRSSCSSVITPLQGMPGVGEQLLSGIPEWGPYLRRATTYSCVSQMRRQQISTHWACTRSTSEAYGGTRSCPSSLTLTSRLTRVWSCTSDFVNIVKIIS